MGAMASPPRSPVEASGEPQGGDLLDTAAAGPAAVRGGALRVISYAAASLIALASGALLYRHLGVVRSGHYNAAGSLIALVAGGSDLGLTAVGIRELAVRSGAARERMASTLLGLRLTITCVGVLGVSCFALISYGPELALGVLLAGIGLVLTVWQGTLAIPLMVGLRLGWTSALEFLRQLLLSLLIVLFVLLGAGVLPFLAATIPASFVVLVLTMLVFRGQVPMHVRFVWSEWRALVAPVLSYGAAVAAAAVYFRVAILLVSLLSSGFELGYFSLSFNVMAALFAIPAMLVGVAFPIFSRAARDDHERLAYGIERVFEVSLIIGAWTSLAIALGSHFAIELIGGPKFAPAAEVLAIQGVSVGSVFVGAVWGFGLLSLGRHRTILLFNLYALVAVIAAVSVMASVDGARGAAIATSAVELANALIGLRLLTHGRAHLHPSLRVVPKVLVAIAIAAAPALLPVPEVARVAISLALYLPVLLLLRALPAELIDLLPRRLRRAS
jgi:O-antigen/teichoic acid export membrane protein